MTNPLFRMTLAVFLMATWFSSRTVSQQATAGSVPLVPEILKAGTTIPEPCPRTASTDPKRYMIEWNDTPGIDGDFMFVVHPTQIFLRSGHNNPNHNYVYWVERLSAGQYENLVKFLDAYRDREFRRNRWDVWPGYTLYELSRPRISPKRPEHLTPESESVWQAKSNAAVNSNLRRILRELNRGVSLQSKLRLDATINTYPDIVRIEEDRAHDRISSSFSQDSSVLPLLSCWGAKVEAAPADVANHGGLDCSRRVTGFRGEWESTNVRADELNSPVR